MKIQFIPWEPDEDVCGEAAAISAGCQTLDLIVTQAPCWLIWEVVDGCEVIAAGRSEDIKSARKAAEVAGRRALISIVTIQDRREP